MTCSAASGAGSPARARTSVRHGEGHGGLRHSGNGAHSASLDLGLLAAPRPRVVAVTSSTPTGSPCPTPPAPARPPASATEPTVADIIGRVSLIRAGGAVALHFDFARAVSSKRDRAQGPYLMPKARGIFHGCAPPAGAWIPGT
jgi:hypothetical protein